MTIGLVCTCVCKEILCSLICDHTVEAKSQFNNFKYNNLWVWIFRNFKIQSVFGQVIKEKFYFYVVKNTYIIYIQMN